MSIEMLFAIIWFGIALYLFFVAFTEDTFFFFIAPFFVILAGWAFINEKTVPDLMAGPLVWVYRGAATVLIIICAVRFIIYNKSS